MGGLLLSVAGSAGAQSTASFPPPSAVAPKSTAAPPPSTPAPVVPKPVPPTPPPRIAEPVRGAPPRPGSAPSPAPAAAAAAGALAANRSTLQSPQPLPAASPSALNFAPALLPYRAGLPVPPGYQVEHRSANGLIIGGVASLVVGYATALAVGGGDNFKNGTGWVVLPVIGPWAAIGARSYHCDNSATDILQAQASANQCVRGAFNEVQTIAILSADAVVQATGAILFLAGLASGEDLLVRTDVAGLRLTPRAVGRDGVGFGFDGRF